MVSTLCVWEYEGGADGSPVAARRGEQRCYADDPVIDDASGQYPARTQHLLRMVVLVSGCVNSALKEVLAYINSGEKEC